jgi:[ribosomal protein S5]-alanine N-acetyltransferase
VIPGLETDRLLLCPLELADAEHVQQIFPRWEIVRYLSNVVPWPYPADGALTYYRDVALPAIARAEAWHWTLRPRTEPQRIIGQVSLMTGEYNRGFWLDLPWQGKGIMSEAVEVATDYWFNSLGFSLMRAYKAVPNLASRRISEKNGMRLVAVEEKDYVAGRFLTEIWEITAEEWRLHRSRR